MKKIVFLVAASLGPSVKAMEPVPFNMGPDDPSVQAAADAVQIDPALLYAVSLVESGTGWTDGVRRPAPWVLRVSGKAVYAESLEELDRVWSAAEARGDTIEDVGPMQVNVRFHGHRVDNPRDLMDPEVNLRIGATILREEIDRAGGDLALGIGRYHHSRYPARTRWYAGQVLRAYRRVIE